MRILGIDPGSRNCGWGIIKITKKRVYYLMSGVIKTTGEQHVSLTELHYKLRGIVLAEKPDTIAMEGIYFSRNISSAIKVGEARGAIYLACEYPIRSYTPQSIKKAISGQGKLSKKELQACVHEKLSVEITNEHEADALAIAYCHGVHLGLIKEIENE